MSHEEWGWVRLSSTPEASSIACTNAGAFVGEVPLLKRGCSPSRSGEWKPRTLADLNADLSDRFGLPVDFTRKMEGLSVVARALSKGNLARAQIATLNLQIPDPPDLRKVEPSVQELIILALRLQASHLLKADWNPEQHPRWPAGSPDSVGGQFAPAGSGSVSNDATLIPAQIAIPLEPVIPDFPTIGPLPFEMVPPPLVVPKAFPRELPANPYPDRPECEEEWAAATKHCYGLVKRGLLGKDGYRGAGRSLSQCIMGQVSQDCGGNIIES